MVKTVVGKAPAVELAVRTAGKAAATDMAHAMAAEAAADMTAAQTTATKAATTVTAATSHAAAAEATATATATAKPAASPASPSPATASKGIAGDNRARQRQSGNQGDNLMQTRILHCGIAFPFDVDRPAPRLTAANSQVRQVLPAI